MNPEKIQDLRKKIDEIDQKIIQLISKRGTYVIEIGKIKKSLKSPFHVPEREEKILTRLKKANPGPYPPEAIETLFREIFSASLALENPLSLAFLGPEGTFTHQAAIKRFGLSANFVPQETIQKVFQEVACKRAHYGVVPIENSTEGVVSYTLDLFTEYPLRICGEIKIPIVHNLLSQENDLSQIEKIYSHPQALAQCRGWLDSHFPHVKIIETTSTAKAAKISTLEKRVAAIASEYAASHYHLNILARHLEDHSGNFTRFVIIGEQECGSTGNDKTSIMFSTKDQVGVLHRLLAPLAKEQINLTKIESRPLKGKAWEYIFFVDLDGHQEDPKVKHALKSMERFCSFLKILGSYPQGNAQ